MHASSTRIAALCGAALLLGLCSVAACGSSGSNGGKGGNNGSSSSGGVPNLSSSSGGGTSSGGNTDGGFVCPAGLQCNVGCSGGTTTTITGKVYDPAGNNPLYNVAVYVPEAPLTPLPTGVPTGADACNCGALFKSGAVTNTTTGVDGSFTLTNVPVGSSVPLVLQVGKWRRSLHVNVSSCKDNPQPDKSLTLPGTVAANDTDDSIPHIAVSTGSADTLECLMRRIGLPDSEYVAGPTGAGHIHVFSGGKSGGKGGGGVGSPEKPPMTGAPVSSTDLWASQGQLMPYDILLLSCEGGETYNANPPALEAYLNAGGRAFASHYHYSWFSGPLETTQAYTAPGDWGNNLAAWSPGGGNANNAIGGIIEQTLNGGGGAFSKGVALAQWLQLVGALGQNAPAGELSIFQPRYNAVVGAGNKPSQPWITSDQSGMAGQTMYFSFDTPVNAPIPPGGTVPNYCGRAVFSDLHVAGDPASNDSNPPPTGCGSGKLTPQEAALEFMLFDLSSCVIPDTVTVPLDGGLPPPPR